MKIEKLSDSRSSFFLRGLRLWTSRGESEPYDWEIENHQVVKKRRSDFDSGVVALPLGFDVQSHLRVPGQPEKEQPLTGLRAALVGGYGGVLSMPNTRPTIDCVEVLQQAQEEISEAERQTGVRAYFTGSLSKSLEGEELVDFEKLSEKGVLAFTDDGLGLASDEKMKEALERLAPLNRPLLQHAEMPGHGGVLAPSRVQERLGVQPYSDDPEIEMLERDLQLLEDCPQARYHLLHATSARAVDRVKVAKAKGLKVTAEVSPHHLFFNSEQIDPQNSAFKMNPPIRSASDQRSLQEALRDGVLDFVATDHAPHASGQKTLDFQSAAFGTIGLETALPVLFYFFQQGLLSASRIVEVFSTRPREFLGLPSRDQFEEGDEVQFCLTRPHSYPVVFQSASIASLSHNSCFLGASLPPGAFASFNSAGVFVWSSQAQGLEENIKFLRPS